MIDNSKKLNNYYNGDDWRLFNPDDFNEITNLDIKIVKNYNNHNIHAYDRDQDPDLQDQN